MTTDRLYYSDSYLRTFDASVLDRSGDGLRVRLDRTAFYPTSGGQPHDLGTLGGQAVVDVRDEAGEVVHLLASPLAADRVQGTIDWPRRFDHMQQHTGQHLLSAVLAELFGHATVSVHFGADSATLDLAVAQIREDEIRQAEARANAVVTENRPVTVGYEEAATAAGLRKASERTGLLRVVTIADLDRSACGGTHVRATGEIGPILVRGVERVKQQVRLSFRCGGRAVARARADYDLLSRMAAASSCAVDDLGGIQEKQRQELQSAQAERRRIEEALHGVRARELYRDASPDASGLRRIVVREPGGTIEALRGLAQALIALPGVMVIGSLDDPPTVLLATSADSSLDAGQHLKAALASRGGRGGGGARIAQGTAPSPALLDQVVNDLLA